MKHKTRKILKISGIVLGSIIGVGLIVVMWFAQKYKHVVKENLPMWVAQSTDSLYKISIKKIRINVFTNSITAKEVHLYPDTNRIKQLKLAYKAPKVLYDVTLPQININGIRWDEIIANNIIGCNKFLLTNPKIIITQIPKADSTITDTSTKKSKIKMLYVDELVVKGAKIKYRNIESEDTTEIILKNGALNLTNWEYRTNKPVDTTKFLLADKGNISCDSIIFAPKGLYKYTTGQVAFNSKDKRITIQDLTIKPTVNRATFYKITGVDGDIYNLSVSSFEAAELNWIKLFSDKAVYVKDVYINHPKLKIYHSRLPPANKESKLGKYPHQLLQKLKLPLYIQNLSLNNGSVEYTELNKDTKMSGTILFDEMDGTLSNISNIDSILSIQDECNINLHGKFNKYSKMDARFILKQSDPLGGFILKGSLQDVQAHQINKQSKALAKLDVRSMNIRSFDMYIYGDENSAKGDFIMRYNGLKIKLLEIEKETKQVKKKGFLSFLANNVFIYTHNPMPGEKVRTVSTYIKRDIHKSFFNLIWKNIYFGALKTAITDPNIIDMLSSESTKPKKQKGVLKKIFKSNKKKKDD